MAEVSGIMLTLSMDEARAVFKALGQMTSTSYNDDVLVDAGQAVYSELTPIVEEEGLGDPMTSLSHLLKIIRCPRRLDCVE